MVGPSADRAAHVPLVSIRRTSTGMIPISVAFLDVPLVTISALENEQIGQSTETCRSANELHRPSAAYAVELDNRLTEAGADAPGPHKGASGAGRT